MGDEGAVGGGAQRAGEGSAIGDVVGEDSVAEDDGVAEDDVGSVGRWAVVMLLVSMLI